MTGLGRAAGLLQRLWGVCLGMMSTAAEEVARNTGWQGSPIRPMALRRAGLAGLAASLKIGEDQLYL